QRLCEERSITLIVSRRKVRTWNRSEKSWMTKLVDCGRLQHAHSLKNGRKYDFVSHACVDHQVVKRAGRPVGPEIMFYEQNTFAINCVNQVLGIMQGFPEISQPSQFLRTWCVHENVERVVTLAQEVRCAAAHDHAIATLRNVLHHMFAHFHHAVRAKGLM